MIQLRQNGRNEQNDDDEARELGSIMLDNEACNEALYDALEREGWKGAVAMLGLMVPMEKVGTDYRELLIEYTDERRGRGGCAIIRGRMKDLPGLLLRQVARDHRTEDFRRK